MTCSATQRMHCCFFHYNNGYANASLYYYVVVPCLSRLFCLRFRQRAVLKFSSKIYPRTRDFAVVQVRVVTENYSFTVAAGNKGTPTHSLLPAWINNAAAGR